MLGFFKRNLPGTFLTKNETEILKGRVGIFEKNTGCELVFHFRRKLGSNPTDFNRRLFFKFKLDQTTGARGILITLALNDRQFSVWADQGVAIHTGDKLWNSLCEGLGRDLKTGDHLRALLNAVDAAEKMLQNLPHLHNTKNELSDDPIIEDE